MLPVMTTLRCRDAAAPLVHDFATPRRQVGGRCRKWAVSTQQTTNASVLPAACVVSNSAMVKRLQQWSNRNSLRANVHSQRVHGGVAHDHELHQSNPRIRTQLKPLHDNVEAAADSEALLHFAPVSDQASTAAPSEDDQSWTSSGSMRSRGTASKTSVAPRTFSHRQDLSLHYTRRNMPFYVPSRTRTPPSLASEPSWKALVLSSWSLLGKPAVNASESNFAHFLEARLDLFWAEDSPALWAMVRAECDVAPVSSAKRKTSTEQNSRHAFQCKAQNCNRTKQSRISQSDHAGSIR